MLNSAVGVSESLLKIALEVIDLHSSRGRVLLYLSQEIIGPEQSHRFLSFDCDIVILNRGKCVLLMKQ